MKDALKKYDIKESDPGPSKGSEGGELLNLASIKEIKLNYPVGVSNNNEDFAFYAA